MANESRETHINTDLQGFTEKLRTDCYDTIEKLCDTTQKQIESIQSKEANRPPSQYLSVCRDIIGEVRLYITGRKEKYIPYLLQLSEKANEAHDCSNCSGGCKLNHDMHLLELRASNGIIKNILNRLQTIVLPLYSDTTYPEAYRILRNQMALIENGMAELFFLEENYLVPKVLAAQKKINAGNK